MITDGSYNKLLGLNWIRADIDGDGVLELVFTGTKAGVKPPNNVYDLKYTENSDSDNSYYVNGNLYTNWDDIPESTRVANSNTDMPAMSDPDATKFRF